MLLDKEAYKSAMSNDEFTALTKKYIDTNYNQPPYDNEDYFNLTKVNLRRLEGFSKKVQLKEELVNEVTKGIDSWTFILLNEPWCTDGSFSQPVINSIVEASDGKIKLKVLLRDENLDVMDQFLTNGGRAIPKLIVLDEENEVITTWGPRPNVLQEKVAELLKDESVTLMDKLKMVNKWYNKDKGQSLQEDLLVLIKETKNR